jgi:hypothetical protein
LFFQASVLAPNGARNPVSKPKGINVTSIPIATNLNVVPMVRRWTKTSLNMHVPRPLHQIIFVHKQEDVGMSSGYFESLQQASLEPQPSVVLAQKDWNTVPSTPVAL